MRGEVSGEMREGRGTTTCVSSTSGAAPFSDTKSERRRSRARHRSFGDCVSSACSIAMSAASATWPSGAPATAAASYVTSHLAISSIIISGVGASNGSLWYIHTAARRGEACGKRVSSKQARKQARRLVCGARSESRRGCVRL